MELEKNNIVTLNGGSEYLIVDTILYNANKYLYLARLDQDELAFVKVDNRDNVLVLAKLSDEEYQVVSRLFAEKQ